MKYIQSKAINIKHLEWIIYVVIWLSIFAISFLKHRNGNQVDWNKLWLEWANIASYCTIFSINAYLFVPGFLFRKKYLGYIGSTLLVLVVVS